MSGIKNYEIDIVERTCYLLKNHFDHFRKNNLEVTFSMNCLLGIIIAIVENEKRSSRSFSGTCDDDFLKNIPSKVGFISIEKDKSNLTKTEQRYVVLENHHKEELKRKSKLWLLKKIRNGIAHQNIEGLNLDENWVGVRISNMNNDHKDFEIEFEIEELKSFALYLAEKYLNSIKES